MALQSRHFARGGAFSFAGPGGFRGAVVYGLAGLVRTNGTALGALDLTVTFTNSSGAFVDKCSKSGISWHARKQ